MNFQYSPARPAGEGQLMLKKALNAGSKNILIDIDERIDDLNNMYFWTSLTM